MRSFWAPLSPVLLAASLLVGCGGRSAVPAGELRPPRSARPPQLPADRVRVIERTGRPVLQLVRRGGDPHGALAVAVFPEGGSDAVVALGALLHARLRAAGYVDVSLQTHAEGLVVAAKAPSADDALGFLAATRAALAKPLGEKEAGLELAKAWVTERRQRTSTGSLVGRCSGELGADDDSKARPRRVFDAGELETWRASAYAAPRVGVAAVGTEPLLAALQSAEDEPWPEGSAPADPWPERDEVAVVDAPAGRSLRLAWRLDDAGQALAVARALSDESHPLRHRLQALGPWEVATADATLRPRGACLRLDLVRRDENARLSASELAEAALLTSAEVERARETVTVGHERELAVLAPTNPLAAAALAAWAAVRNDEGSGPPRRFVELAAPETDRRPGRQALAEALRKTEAAWRERTLPYRFRVEEGQAELWLLVASPCGTRFEPENEAGTLGLAVRSIASAASQSQSDTAVVLEPWLTPEGVGVLAHGGRLAGETPRAQAERIARVVGRALAGDPLDGRVVADARTTAEHRLSADTGYWLALETLSGRHPSALTPLGTWKAVTTTSASDVERARTALAQGPLQLAILANEDGSQAEAAAAALSDWLAPLRESGVACPSDAPVTPQAGQWTLGTIDDQVREGAYVSVWAPGPTELGRATEFLLNRPGGYLERALTVPGLVSTAEARWLGGNESGALLIELGALPEQLDAAIAQTRALLARLAEGAATKRDAELARAEQAATDEAVHLSPRGRVVQLWFDRKPTPVTLEGLHELHRAFAADRHLVVRVKRRK